MSKFCDFLNWGAKIVVKYLVPITASVFPYPNVITLVSLILTVAGVSIMPSGRLLGSVLDYCFRSV